MFTEQSIILDLEPNYRWEKMTLDRWQHHDVIFTQILVGLLVKSVVFSNHCCIISQWGPFGNGGKTRFVLFFQSLRACNSRSIKDILTSS